MWELWEESQYPHRPRSSWHVSTASCTILLILEALRYKIEDACRESPEGERVWKSKSRNHHKAPQISGPKEGTHLDWLTEQNNSDHRCKIPSNYWPLSHQQKEDVVDIKKFYWLERASLKDNTHEQTLSTRSIEAGVYYSQQVPGCAKLPWALSST